MIIFLVLRHTFRLEIVSCLEPRNESIRSKVTQQAQRVEWT